MASRKIDETARFENEADLCASFIEQVGKWHRTDEWTAYPETEGWDILLVRSDGIQIGIEAKMQFNVKVLDQAIETYTRGFYDKGPDFRAILVPAYATDKLSTIADRLGVTVIRCSKPQRGIWHGLSPGLPSANWDYDDRYWHPWCPVEREILPDYVPDVVAGASAPVKLSRWKIQAIKLQIVLRDRPVTRSDFKELGLSPSRWLDRFNGWLVPTTAGYVARESMPDFKEAHPKVWDEIEADAAQWRVGALVG